MPSLTNTDFLVIDIGARSSPLSQAQVKEVLSELNDKHSHVIFRSHYVESQGDLDQKTSLRSLERTNFFTKEIDEMLLSGKCRIGIHSAKDLPDPIPNGLTIAALTDGVDRSDSLVMRPGETIASLPQGAKIATSSVRREEIIKSLRSDFQCIDIRGNIGTRLKWLDIGKADGVVVAEAALIRLRLKNLNRIKLPGETAPYQGQLAILARENDYEMLDLFSSIDARRRILYLGTETPKTDPYKITVHCPFIEVIPRNLNSPSLQEAFEELNSYTHILFSSKNAVDIFFDHLKNYRYPLNVIKNAEIWAIGKATQERLNKYQVNASQVAKDEKLEGFIELFEKENHSNSYVLWPHSSLSRSILTDYLIQKQISHQAVVLYDTKPCKPALLPDVKNFDEIIFTSPSTVDAFIQFYGKLPKNKTLTSQGDITQERLSFYLLK